jgi:hypothetical protein
MIKKYTMSFTAASLMKPESRILANAYAQNQCWTDVERLVLQKNILGTRTISSAKRLYRELKMRLQRLSNKALSYLANEATDEEQSQILWYSICETYPFIRDFAVEVLHENISALKFSVNKEDYDRFFNKKAQWHSELDSLSESSEQKIRQVIFRMLREAGFTDKEGNLYTANISKCVLVALDTEVSILTEIFPTAAKGRLI